MQDFQRMSRLPPYIFQIVDSLKNGQFSSGDKDFYRILVDGLLDPHDPYVLLKDLQDYLRCQDEVSQAYLDKKSWWRKSILNVAGMGKFSTDRTIRQYAEEIWGIKVSKG